MDQEAASFRSTRGYTLIAALLDEVAFWRSDESANPDKEILAALRPAMATIPGAMLLCASSPYARRGALWDAYRKHFGKASPALVWKAPTRTMNPSVPQSVIDAAIEADPSSAAAEYMAEFRTDVESFVSREVVDAAVIMGRFELPRIEGCNYVAFVDPSGGSSDSMTLAISHMEGDHAILDLVRERKPPFSPDDVAKEFADTIKLYGIASVKGDRYGGMWPRERLAVHGIDYHVATPPKSDIYLTLLPILNSGRVELLDHPRLTSQLCALERRTARGGRDSIDHSPGAHDDIINAAAGAIVMAAQRTAQQVPTHHRRPGTHSLGRHRFDGGGVVRVGLWGRQHRFFLGAAVTKGRRPPGIFHENPSDEFPALRVNRYPSPLPRPPEAKGHTFESCRVRHFARSRIASLRPPLRHAAALKV
jgi:hypothetical protein